MNLFQNVKYGVSCREAAERYGVSVNRQGKALCPFHNDRHPSLYVADNHYFCFACGAHGDVIDFAADFFICRFTKPPSGLRQTSALTRTDRQQRKFLKSADSKQKHSSSRKTSGCAFLFCPITPAYCGTGSCGMRRSRLTRPFTHGLRKPVTNSTKRNTIWIFCAPGILTNVPKWCSSRWRTASWTGCKED